MGGIYNRIERHAGYRLEEIDVGDTKRIWQIFGPDAVGQYWTAGPDALNGIFYRLSSRGLVLSSVVLGGSGTCGAIDKYGFPWVGIVDDVGATYRAHKLELDGSGSTFLALTDGADGHKPFGMVSFGDYLYVVGINATTSSIRLFRIDVTPGAEALDGFGTSTPSAGAVENQMLLVPVGSSVFWCTDPNRTGALIEFEIASLSPSLQNLTYSVGAATSGLLGIHNAFGSFWVGGDTLDSVGASPPQLLKVDSTGTVTALLQFSDALRLSAISSDDRHLYVAATGKSGASNIGDNRVSKVLPNNENLLTRSEEFDHADWSKVGATITVDPGITPPTGLSGTTADTLVEDTSTGQHEVYQSVAGISSRYTFSAYIQARARNWVRLSTDNPSGGVYFNVSTGATGEVDWALDRNPEFTIEDAGNSWYRVSVTVDPSTAGVTRFVISAADADGSDSYTGSGSDALNLLGAQVVQHTELTSYVATSATALTEQITIEDEFNFDGGQGEEVRSLLVVSDDPLSPFPQPTFVDAAVWLRADDPEIPADGTAILSVPNRGPQRSERSLFPVGAANRPGRAVAPNGLPALLFDGSDDSLSLITPPDYSVLSTYFNGTDEYVTMGDLFGFEYTDDFSLSVWFKWSASDYAMMVFKQAAATTYQGYSLLGLTDGRLQFALVSDQGTTNKIEVRTSASFNDGVWHHVVATWKGNASPVAVDAKIYVDGLLQAQDPPVDALSGTITTSAVFSLGQRAAAVSSTGSQNLDEVAIYNKELSVSEVSDIFGLGIPSDLGSLSSAANLVGWWRMGEGDTAPILSSMVAEGGIAIFPNIPDETANENDGTMTNMTAADIVPWVPWSNFSQYCYQFNGTSHYITMGNVLNLERDEAWSISAWFQKTAASDGMILAKQGNTNPEGWHLSVDSLGKISTGLTHTWITNAIAVDTVETGFHDGDWHHVVVSFDGVTHPSSAGAVSIYVDGVKLTNNVTYDTLTSDIANAFDVTIGRRIHASSPLYHDGLLSDIAVYTKALSLAEAQWIYNGGTPRDLRLPAAPSDLKAYWRLGEAGEQPQYSWVGKIHQWVWDTTAIKESTAITDAGPYTSHGTLYNIVAGDVTTDTPGGISQYSCSFNGINKGMFCNVGSTVYGPYNFDRPGLFTMSGWVKTTDTSGYLWGNANDLGAPYWQGYGMVLDAGRPKFAWGRIPIYRTEVVGNNTINDGAWHFVVVAAHFDFSGFHGATIWVDGVQQPTTILATYPSTYTGVGFSIGAYGPSQLEPVNALIDEVAVWSKLFTQDDVDELYGIAGVPIDLRDASFAWSLRGWWRMGDAYFASGDPEWLTYEDKIPTAPAGASGYSTHSLKMATTDYVAVAHGPEVDFDYDEAFSISSWIFPLGLNGYRSIWHKRTGAGTGTGIGITYYGGSGGATYDGRGVIAVECDGASGYWEVYPGGWNNCLVPYGEWFHFVLTHDGSNDANGIKFYINGKQVPTWARYNVAFGGGDTMKNGADVWLGREATYWVGNQDEVSAWNKELSQAEVTELFNSGDPFDLSAHSAVANLVGWWRMGEAAPDGTMVNMDNGNFVADVPLLGAPLAFLHDGSPFTMVAAFRVTGGTTQTVMTTIPSSIDNADTGAALIYDASNTNVRLVIANGSGVDFVLDKTTAVGTLPLDTVAIVSVRVDFSSTPEAEITIWDSADFAEGVEEEGTATAQTPSSADVGAFTVGDSGEGALTGDFLEGAVLERRVEDNELRDLVEYLMRWM